MPNLRQLKRRIRSIQNTGKVTKAMEMIAASKMRRAQAEVVAGRPYANKISDVLGHLAAQPVAEGVETIHPLLQTRLPKKIQIVHITSDRGLCGGMNGALNRHTSQFILRKDKEGISVNAICVGKKGRDFMVRYGQDVRGIFTNLGDRPALLDTLAISRIAIDDYTDALVDEVYVAYVRFISITVQQPVLQKILPVEPADIGTSLRGGYIYEPDARRVMDGLLPRFVEMQVYHALLESVASEQSARMVAMRNATDNAKDIMEDLTLRMNKVRQDSITEELLDIISGAVALEK